MGPRRMRNSLKAQAAALAALLLASGLPPQVLTQGVGGEQIVVVEARENVFLLAGRGANTVVQVGPQGVLVVDTKTAGAADDLLAAIDSIAPGATIRYVVNTSADPDHTGGNAEVAAAGSQLIGGNFLRELGTVGAQSAFIFAHENILNALLSAVDGRPPAVFDALPTDTFFQARKDLYVNGEGVQLLHQPAAHSDGDTFVFFRSSDVIAAGDVFNMTTFPVIDLRRGGSVNGLIEALNTLVDLVVSEQYSEGGTLVVPSHGRMAEEMDVVQYRDMVTIVRDRVREMIESGSSLGDVQAARPAYEWEPRFGADAGPGTTAMFVESVYRSLAEQPAGGQ